jgi:uncharacterized OB-fold protein
MISPAQYWRQNKEWQNWLGKQGKVVGVTRVHVAPPGQENFAPYSMALVDFILEKRLFMVAGREEVNVGDTVECVLRKVAQPDQCGIIPYGIKVRRF